MKDKVAILNKKFQKETFLKIDPLKCNRWQNKLKRCT